MARNDRFSDAFERFNTNLLRVMGLARSSGEVDDGLEHYRQRLEEFARQSPRTPGQALKIPPPARNAPLTSSDIDTTEASPLYDQFDDPTTGGGVPDGDNVTSGVDTKDLTVRGADGGYGTFAVLQPKVSATKTRRTSVRSVPKNTQPVATRSIPKATEPVAKRSVPKGAEVRRQDAEDRIRMRQSRPGTLPLVRTPGGFLVPDKPAPLLLPEVPLPPAPRAGSGLT